jgi:hypothetical protein
MALRRLFALFSVLMIGLSFAQAQDSSQRRGRKYKVPEETSHITVVVLKGQSGKPILNAAVIFHPVKDGKDEGNLEVKTNDDGKAIIDVIPTGSSVDVQVIADGFATFAGTYMVSEPTREIEVRMIRPRAQISTYVDMHGQATQRQPGVQEPNKPSTPAVVQPLKSPNDTSDPTALAPGAMNYAPPAPKTDTRGNQLQTNPPNMHPDNQYPVDPAAAPATGNRTPSPTTPPQL